MKTDGGSAFPIVLPTEDAEAFSDGLSKRELAAMFALAGLLAGGRSISCSKDAWKYADALLAAEESSE